MTDSDQCGGFNKMIGRIEAYLEKAQSLGVERSIIGREGPGLSMTDLAALLAMARQSVGAETDTECRQCQGLGYAGSPEGMLIKDCPKCNGSGRLASPPNREGQDLVEATDEQIVQAVFAAMDKDIEATTDEFDRSVKARARAEAISGKRDEFKPDAIRVIRYFLAALSAAGSAER